MIVSLTQKDVFIGCVPNIEVFTGCVPDTDRSVHWLCPLQRNLYSRAWTAGQMSGPLFKTHALHLLKLPAMPARSTIHACQYQALFGVAFCFII